MIEIKFGHNNFLNLGKIAIIGYGEKKLGKIRNSGI